jgi:hypothetical protein
MEVFQCDNGGVVVHYRRTSGVRGARRLVRVAIPPPQPVPTVAAIAAAGRRDEAGEEEEWTETA